jgi:TetR/AcrR family transcriptional repressor of nem operon
MLPRSARKPGPEPAGQWSTTLRDGLRSLHAAGLLRADLNPDDLATTLLATLEGGTLLAQVQRDTRPLETAIDTLLALAVVR